ncbi:MAG: hypothetical protein RLZZ135_363, partial [Cyanobacteriota bacterium]
MNFKSIGYMALSSRLVLGTFIGWFYLTEGAIADTLTTKQFRIDIQRNCAEGNVTCDRVSYRGKDLKTGKSIQLSGRTMHTKCADGVTPCRFIGYEFRNRDYRYIVTEYGNLDIYRGKQLILSQPGTWEK